MNDKDEHLPPKNFSYPPCGRCFLNIRVVVFLALVIEFTTLPSMAEPVVQSSGAKSKPAASAAAEAATSPAGKGRPGKQDETQPVTKVKGKAKQTAAAKKRMGLNESQAVTLVSNRAEVKAWKHRILTEKLARQRGCRPYIELDRKESGDFVVHVYEDVPDGGGDSHSATFNWYHVNGKTGKVTTEF